MDNETGAAGADGTCTDTDRFHTNLSTTITFSVMCKKVHK